MDTGDNSIRHFLRILTGDGAGGVLSVIARERLRPHFADSPPVQEALSTPDANLAEEVAATIGSAIRGRLDVDPRFSEVLDELLEEIENLRSQVETAALRAAENIDIDQLIATLGGEKAAFLALVQERVAEAMSGLTPKAAWSVTVNRDNTTQVLSITDVEYVPAMVQVLRKKPYRGASVDSAVTPVVIGAVEDALLTFYSSQQIQTLIASELGRQVEKHVAATDVISADVMALIGYAGTEVMGVAALSAAKVVAIDRATHLLAAFFATAHGHVVLGVVGKFVATPAGKIAVTKLAIIIGNSIAAGALKPVIAGIVKKVGVMVLLKTAVGKAVLGTIASTLNIRHFRHGHALVYAAVAMLVVGSSVYQYNKLPQKLAKDLPQQVADVLSGKYEEVTHSAVEQTFRSMIEALMWRIAGGGIHPVAT